MKEQKLHIIGAVLSVAGLSVFAIEHAFYFYVFDNMTKIATILSQVLFFGGLVCQLWGTRKSEPIRFWTVSATAVLTVMSSILCIVFSYGEYFNIRETLVMNREYMFAIPGLAWLSAVTAIVCLAVRKKLHVDDIPGMAAAVAIVIVACIPRLLDIAGLDLITKIRWAVITNEDYLVYMTVMLVPIAAVVTLPLNQYLGRYRRQTTFALALLSIAGLIAWNIITVVHAEYYVRQRIPVEIVFAAGLVFTGVSLLKDLLTASRRCTMNWRMFSWATVIAVVISALMFLRFRMDLYMPNPAVEFLLTMPFCLTAVLYYAGEFLLSGKRKTLTWIGHATLLLMICAEYMLAVIDQERRLVSEDEYLCEEDIDGDVSEPPVLQSFGDSVLSDAIVQSDARYGILLLIDDSCSGLSAISEMTIDSLGLCHNIHHEAFFMLTPQKSLSLFTPVILGAILDDSVTHNINDIEIADALASDKALLRLMSRCYGNRRYDFIKKLNEILYNAGGDEVKPLDSLSSNRSLAELVSGQDVLESPHDILNIYHSIAGDGTNRDVYYDFFENHRLGLQVFSKGTSQKILAAMRTNVERGDLCELVGLPVAALHTSSPRIYAGQMRSDCYTVGIFPYDKPRYTCLIMLFDTKPQSNQSIKTLRQVVSSLVLED